MASAFFEIEDDFDHHNHDEIYRQLQHEGAEAFGTKGYHAVSIADICALARVDESDFKARFINKEDLFCAAFEYHFEELRLAVMRALLPPPGSPEVVAKRGVKAYVQYLKQHPSVARTLFGEASRVGTQADALYHSRINDFALAIYSLLASLYEAEMPMNDDAQLWMIKSIVGSLVITTHLWTEENFATPEEALIEAFTELCLGAAKHWLQELRFDKKLASSRASLSTEGRVSLGYVLPMIEYIYEHGLNTDHAFDILGIDESSLDTYATMVPAQQHMEAFNWLVSVSGDDDIGLHVGMRMRLSRLGILGQLLMTSHSLKEAGVLYRRFGSLLLNERETLFIRAEGLLYFTTPHPFTQQRFGFQHAVRYVATVVAIFRDLCGQHVRPERIEMPFPRPGNIAALTQYFRCDIQFDASELRCCFAEQLPALILPAAIPELRRALEEEADRQLHVMAGMETDADPRIAALKHYLRKNLSRSSIEIAEAAAEIGESPRRLRRLLEKRRTSFSEIFDSIRREASVRLLQDPDISLVDVAIALGFSDQSSFTKAFKRWYSETPNDFRRTSPTCKK